MQPAKPSINQISFLSEQIKKDEALNKHFILEDVYDKLSKIKTEAQYDYWIYLLIKGKRDKLNNMMLDFCFNRRKL